MKTFEACEQEVHDRLEAVIKKHHPDLEQCGLMVDLVWIRDDTALHPLVCGGYVANAVIRVCSLKERAMGRRDVEITIDEKAFDEFTPKQQDALLDHEITHVQLSKDEFERPLYDDLHRPKVKMRKHDFQVGWFDECAVRHGKDSMEALQARAFFHSPEAGPYLADGQPAGAQEEDGE